VPHHNVIVGAKMTPVSIKYHSF